MAHPLARFACSFGQQDSQEFLRFVVAGLHDDLNRITNPPPYVQIEARESRPVCYSFIVNLFT